MTFPGYCFLFLFLLFGLDIETIYAARWGQKAYT